MLAILPDIYESGIWKNYASTIFEYAGKYGGLGRSIVEKRLKLEKDLVDKPQLREAIGMAGLYKVAMVAKLATPETDKAFADKIQNLSKSAVNMLAKELRNNDNDKLQVATICEAKPETINIELDEEMAFLFLKLKKKYGKKLGHRDAMRIILRKMDEIEHGEGGLKNGCKTRKNRVLSENFPGKNDTKMEKYGEIDYEKIAARQEPVGRYVSVPIRREELSKTSGRCAYPGCNRPPDNWHHRDRFSESHSHDSVVPLCKEHHEFMHNGLVKNELSEPKNWQLNVLGTLKEQADFLYRKYRLKAV